MSTPIENLRAVLAVLPASMNDIGVITVGTPGSDAITVKLSLEDLRSILADAEAAIRYNRALQEACTAARVTHGDITVELTPAIERLNSTIGNLREQLRQMTAQSATLAGERDMLKTRLADLRADAVPSYIMHTLDNLVGVSTWRHYGSPTPEQTVAAITRLVETRNRLEQERDGLRTQRDQYGADCQSAEKAHDKLMETLHESLTIATGSDEWRGKATDFGAAAVIAISGLQFKVSAKEALTEQLVKSNERRRQVQDELANLKAHCTRIEAENQRYRGSTLDAKAAHERRQSDEVARRMVWWVKAASCIGERRWVFVGPSGNVYASKTKPSPHISASPDVLSGWLSSNDDTNKIGITTEIELRTFWVDTLTPIPAADSKTVGADHSHKPAAGASINLGASAGPITVTDLTGRFVTVHVPKENR